MLREFEDTSFSNFKLTLAKLCKRKILTIYCIMEKISEIY
jgi:hypothetical protein